MRAYRCIVFIAGLLGFATGLTAGELAGCGTCQGSVYYLTYEMRQQNVAMPIEGIGNPQVDVVRIFYTIDTRAYEAPGSTQQVYLDQVAQKSSTTVYLRTLYDAPDEFGNQGRPDLWTLEFGGLGGKGCSGAGKGFECSDFISNRPPGVRVPNANPLLQWVFDDVIPTGTLFTDSGSGMTLASSTSASIKARYVDTTGNKVGALVSESIRLTPQPSGQIPEPASVALLATVVGFTALGASRRRRRGRYTTPAT